MVDCDLVGMGYERGEVRYVYEIDTVYGNAVAVFDQYSVVGEHTREGLPGWGKWQRLFERRAISVDFEAGEMNSPAAAATEDRTALEAGRSSQRGAIAAANRQIVSAFGQLHFGRDFSNAGWELEDTRSGQP